MAAIVQHGRRKGTMRSPSHEQQNAALLPLSEWSRIQSRLTGVNREKEEAKIRQEKREARHQKSLSTVKNWGNTIEGQRLKRLENRKLKAIKDEEEKLRIDEEEAKFQAEERKKAIERAKTLLYYRTDRVKAFHSSLILSEVLREREQQIKCKNIRKELLDLQEKEYLRMKEEEREKAILVDLEAAKEKVAASKDTSQYQLTQAAIKEVYKKEQRKLQLEEQAALEREFQQFKEKELERERQHFKEMQDHRRDLGKIIDDKRARSAREKEKEKAEDEERRIFAAAKKNMMKQRKIKEAQIIREVQDHQEKIKTQLQKINETKESNEDERIMQAVAEQEAKKEREEKEKHEKLLQSLKDIYSHRVKMMAEHQQQEKEKAEMEQELLRQRVAQDERFHAVQLQKHKKATMDAKDVQKFHQAQMEERYKKDDIEMLEEHDEWQKNMEFLKLEEQQFQEYADHVIAAAKERNAPVYPLKTAAKSGPGGGKGNILSGKGGVRPSYQTTDAQGTQLPSYTIDNARLPLSWRIKNTKKRMGFTW